MSNDLNIQTGEVCPACQAELQIDDPPEPTYPCQTCGKRVYHTGILVIPVMGPAGTPPSVTRTSAPYWEEI